MLIVLGKKNLDRLKETLAIPGVGMRIVSWWIIPIFKVEITYDL